MPRVTVLTAVYNGARYLPETIACIQAQTFTDWEYIIVDDASTDETPAIIEQAAAHDPRIRLLRRATSEGPYVAANDGLRAAQGEYVVRIDADDLSPAHRIQRQLDFLADHPQYRACVSFWQKFNDQTGMGSIGTIPTRPKVLRYLLVFRSAAHHSSACVERAAYEAIGGYHPKPTSQDYRLWCELTRRDWLGIIPESLAYARYHSQRISVEKEILQRELALEVMADHVYALSGERWTPDDLAVLWSITHARPAPLAAGQIILARWDRLWQTAPDLDADDRHDLRALSLAKRWDHLEVNARRHPGAFVREALKLAAREPVFVARRMTRLAGDRIRR